VWETKSVHHFTDRAMGTLKCGKQNQFVILLSEVWGQCGKQNQFITLLAELSGL